ncbi:hypothetical protein E1281_26545 [Actinomadura sp. KC345]|uniref:hypothetical protein n=1 Tax=Actinomadura sp. KC345 TaxID=2530371 RepID=UPI0010535558|nr:hypothetical protein [Actinomadura sp. KC345]TDC47242.1 hypothetical protein E1281_26545 [Actinomadura sp. KC345]
MIPATATGGEPWPLTVILSVCSGVIVTVTMTEVYAVAWLGTLITATVTVMCVMLLGWLAFRLLKSMDDRVRTPLPTALTSLVWGAAGAALMAVVLLAGATTVRFLEEHTGACGLPLELRVLNAPETLPSTASPGDGGTAGNVPQGAASPRQKNAVTNGLEAVASTGADRPLIDAIEAADLGPGRPDLILVTDGQSPDTNPRLGSRAAWLSGEFRERHPDLRVTVVLTGPAACDSRPVEEVVDALGPGDGGACVALTEAPEAEQAAALLSDLR